jgi:hypothetical protein
VLKKWYRSAGYWGGSARISADRRAFAAVAAGGRPRTSGFAHDVDDIVTICMKKNVNRMRFFEKLLMKQFEMKILRKLK